MNRSRLALAAIGVLVSAGMAGAQSAAVTVGGAATAAPGDMIVITLSADYDTVGAPGGIFGAAGFYGFGGTVNATGSAAGMVSAASPQLQPMLTFGPVAAVNEPTSLVRAAAGRGLDGGLADNPADMLTFTLDIDAGVATPSEVTLDFDGTVVLVIGSDLESFSTSPGLNQNPLTTNSLTVTIDGSAACPCDFNLAGPDGNVDVLDLLDFLSLWFVLDIGADYNGDLVVDVLDLLDFLSCWFPASSGPC